MIVTLPSSDPEFERYLRGTFSTDERALPVRSLNLSSKRESVTFEIFPKTKCRTVSWFRVWVEALRPWALVLSLGPLLLTWILCLADQPLKRELMVLSILSVACLHISANLLNDYFDHLRGVDRINRRAGTQVIQKGWLAAHHVLKTGYAFSILAIVLSAPVVTQSFSVLLVIALLTAGLMLQFMSSRLRAGKIGETILFLLFGPLLTSSFAFVATGEWVVESLWLGLWTGMSAANIYFLRALENVMVDRQAGSRTWATRAGFDGAKKLAVFFAVLRIFALMFFVFQSKFQWAWGVVACEIWIEAILMRRLIRAKSPLSSAMRGLHVRAWKAYASLSLLWVAGALLS